MKKFTWWSPGGATAKLTEKEKIWLKEHPDWEIKWTAFYRCNFLNNLEVRRYDKYMTSKGYIKTN
jgi:hypothetical protein